MFKTLQLLCSLSVCLVCSGVAFPEQSPPTGKETLADCSLALEMGQATYLADLLKESKPLPSQAQQTRAIQCLGYVVGFKDAIYMRQIYDEKNDIKPTICLPYNSLNNAQAARIVVKYLKEHPELQGRPQEALVFSAFYYAFPCTN
jgi:hypothetical protein